MRARLSCLLAKNSWSSTVDKWLEVNAHVYKSDTLLKMDNCFHSDILLFIFSLDDWIPPCSHKIPYISSREQSAVLSLKPLLFFPQSATLFMPIQQGIYIQCFSVCPNIYWPSFFFILLVYLKHFLFIYFNFGQFILGMTDQWSCHLSANLLYYNCYYLMLAHCCYNCFFCFCCY